jgi:hypothetical protein
MESSTTIIVVVILALFIVPIVFINWNNARLLKQKIVRFRSVGADHQLQLSELDVWGQNGIGIDNVSKCVLFAKNIGQDEYVEKIDLNKLKKCEVNKVAREMQSASSIDQINLRLIFKDSNRANMLLEFYTISGNLQINGELQLAEKWEKIINKAAN